MHKSEVGVCSRLGLAVAASRVCIAQRRWHRVAEPAAGSPWLVMPPQWPLKSLKAFSVASSLPRASDGSRCTPGWLTQVVPWGEDSCLLLRLIAWLGLVNRCGN